MKSSTFDPGLTNARNVQNILKFSFYWETLQSYTIDFLSLCQCMSGQERSMVQGRGTRIPRISRLGSYSIKCLCVSLLGIQMIVCQ